MKKLTLSARKILRWHKRKPATKKLIRSYCVKGVRRLRYSRGFGVHSPFAFDLITQVIEEKAMYYSYQQIEAIRNKCLTKRLLPAEQFKRKEIPFKRAALLFRLANRFKPESIIEIGSSWGISTLYLAMGAPCANCISIESDQEIVTWAAQVVCQQAGVSNITLKSGELADELPDIINQISSVGFIFVHRSESDLFYREWFGLLENKIDSQAVVVIEDIHATPESYKQWQHFINRTEVRVTMDLYDLGLMFYDPKLNKQNYIVAF